MQTNRLQIAGYLAAKPQLRYLPSGTKVATVRLGETYRSRTDANDGESHTNWHSLSFYRELADIAVTYEQGDNIFVEGFLQQRKFTPKADGITRTVHEVVVRSCHVIAPARGVAAAAAVRGDTPTEKGGDQYDSWPVGPG